MIMRYGAAALLLASALSSLKGQSSRPVESPDITAAAVLRADSSHDWRMLLALAHPEALLEFRRDQVRSLQFKDFSAFPGASACFAQQMDKRNRLLLDSVFRVPNVDSLARMAPESVFAREQRPWANLRMPVDSFTPKRTVVGYVIADDSTAYVIVEDRYNRRPLPDWPERRPQIMTFRRYRGTWRSMLDPDIGHGSGWMMESSECR